MNKVQLKKRQQQRHNLLKMNFITFILLAILATTTATAQPAKRHANIKQYQKLMRSLANRHRKMTRGSLYKIMH